VDIILYLLYVIMVESKYTIELERVYGEALPSKGKASLSKFFKIHRDLLDEVYDRGLAAARSTGMRRSVTSAHQWARARMNKYILNVMKVREGKGESVKKGAGEDFDLVIKGVSEKDKGRQPKAVIYLKKAKPNSSAKYVATYKGESRGGLDKKYKFGDKNYRDFILMGDKNSKFYEPNEEERRRVRANYRRRHRKDNLRKVSSGSLSYYLLWGEPTLRKSIKEYEKLFNVDIVF